MSKKDEVVDTKVRNPTAIYFDDESLTHQEFKAECDISTIMNRFNNTGVISHMTQVQAQYGDFSEVPDYAEALRIVREADEAFNALPAHLRFEFKNDPAQFLEFVSNSDNREKMVELGMVEKLNSRRLF